MHADVPEDTLAPAALQKALDVKTLAFIRSFGVDIDKTNVTLMPALSEAEDDTLYSEDCYVLEFFFAGMFEAIPSTQWDFYFDALDGEEAIFEIDEATPQRVLINDVFAAYTSEDVMGTYKFSPAAAYDDAFEGWHSGYIVCKALFRV